MKLLFSLLLLLSLTLSLPAQSIRDTITIDVTKELVAPKFYTVLKTSSPIIIDGLADEPSWQNTSYTDAFIDIEGHKSVPYNTRAKMLWDNHYLYIYAQLEEPHIWADITKRDAVIFYNNDFEVFISPNKTASQYFELEVNALNTVWDLYLDKAYRDGGHALNHWNMEALKSAVYIKGSLNNPNDRDQFWSVELALPLAALTEGCAVPNKLPKVGDQWRVNFSRVEWDYTVNNGQYERKKDKEGDYLPEYNWVWSNQNVINMHEPEKWGTIEFAALNATQRQLSNDEIEKRQHEQVAYALYRLTKFGYLKPFNQENVGHRKMLKINAANNRYIATFYKTHYGFEYSITTPGGSQYLINQLAHFKRVIHE